MFAKGTVLSICLAFTLFASLSRDVDADGEVNMAIKKQSIDGFGCSTAWLGKLSQNAINTLFGTLGISILRVRIDPNKQWSDELSNAKGAISKGAKGLQVRQSLRIGVPKKFFFVKFFFP